MHDDSLSLLNIFEIEEPEGARHLVCFQEAVLAGSVGLDPRAVVGEFTPRDDGEFDPETFRLNPEFVEAVTAYMNERTARASEVAAQAKAQPESFLLLIDPRSQDETSDEPPLRDVLGAFTVGGEGEIVPDSFQYNPEHVLFDPQSGVSGLFFDREFYLWLHPSGNEGERSKNG